MANGIYLGDAPASQEASAVINAGDQQQQQRQQQALNFLQSGVSPEDVTYRRVQQSLSNLGNAINGQTPEAQFQSLSGAGQEAAPFNPGGVQSPSINTNSSLQGLQNAADIYSGNVNWADNQANPWTVGLSSLANGASILNNSGAFGSAATMPAPNLFPNFNSLLTYTTPASVPGNVTLPAVNDAGPTGGIVA